MATDPEFLIQQLCAHRDFDAAATAVLQAYGGGIRALLRARLGSPSDAEEVFCVFSEKLWTGLPEFGFRCQVKGWAYMLARNAANDYRAAACNQPHRRAPLSQHAPRLVARPRTRTASYRRTGTRDRVRALRKRLPEDDQMLLILRVDQAMAFRDLAAALNDGPELPAAQVLDREAARLRKRFERVKARLRELAVEEGLL